MNREGAETYLRLLGEAELRGSLTAATAASGGRPGHLGRGPGQADRGGSGPDRRRSARRSDRRGHRGRLRPGCERAAAHEQTSQDPARPAGTLPAGTLPPARSHPARFQPEPLPAGAARPGGTMRAAAVARWTAQAQFGGPGWPTRASGLARAWPAGSGGSVDPADPKDPKDPKDPEHPEDPGHGPGQGAGQGADRAESTGSSRSG